MKETSSAFPSRMGGLIIMAACFIIILAGMRAASSIILPFLLSLFIAVICMPPLSWLRGRGVPNGLSLLIVLIGIVLIGLALTVFVGSQANAFSNNIATYQAHLMEKLNGLFTWLSGHGITVSTDLIAKQLDPGMAMRIVAEMISGLSGMLTYGFMILITVVILLFEAIDFPAKFKAASHDSKHSSAQLGQIYGSVNRYLALKTLMSLATGIPIALFLWIVGVDFAFLWGLLAFLFNFIPNIGSIIAAIPAVLLTFIQYGPGTALVVAAGYVVVNILIGVVFEPRVMGRGLGLSTLVVFLSLVFWGWVLGPVGMVLSVPLTMIVKIVLEGYDSTRGAAIMMGPAIDEG